MDVEIDPGNLAATALEGVARFRQFIKDVGLPTTLREVGLNDENDIAAMAAMFLLPCCTSDSGDAGKLNTYVNKATLLRALWRKSRNAITYCLSIPKKKFRTTALHGRTY